MQTVGILKKAKTKNYNFHAQLRAAKYGVDNQKRQNNRHGDSGCTWFKVVFPPTMRICGHKIGEVRWVSVHLEERKPWTRWKKEPFDEICLSLCPLSFPDSTLLSKSVEQGLPRFRPIVPFDYVISSFHLGEVFFLIWKYYVCAGLVRCVDVFRWSSVIGGTGGCWAWLSYRQWFRELSRGPTACQSPVGPQPMRISVHQVVDLILVIIR